jgi:hypothetical protein
MNECELVVMENDSGLQAAMVVVAAAAARARAGRWLPVLARRSSIVVAPAAEVGGGGRNSARLPWLDGGRPRCSAVLICVCVSV